MMMEETACRCVLAKILEYCFHLENILAQSTQELHHTDNPHIGSIPLILCLLVPVIQLFTKRISWISEIHPWNDLLENEAENQKLQQYY